MTKVYVAYMSKVVHDGDDPINVTTDVTGVFDSKDKAVEHIKKSFGGMMEFVYDEERETCKHELYDRTTYVRLIEAFELNKGIDE